MITAYTISFTLTYRQDALDARYGGHHGTGPDDLPLLPVEMLADHLRGAMLPAAHDALAQVPDLDATISGPDLHYDARLTGWLNHPSSLTPEPF